jgi:Uma2 family endonuclease
MSENVATISASQPNRATIAPWTEPKELPLEERTDVTVDELEQLSLPHPAELYEGRVVYKMPNFDHGVIQSNLSFALKQYLKTNPVGLVSSDANFRLWPERPRESRAPDLCFVLKERLPEDLSRFLPMAPDLAIEILSPGDGFEEVMAKVDVYLQRGVKLVWLVIPSAREVLICTAQGKHAVHDRLTAPELLPGFEMPVAEIFEGLETPKV